MFVFLVHISQVGWRIIADLLDQAVGVGRAVSEKLAVKTVDDNCDGFSVYSVVQMERGSTSVIITDDSETL
jgi:hypothetical protein